MNSRRVSLGTSLIAWLSFCLPVDVAALEVEDVVRLRASGYQEGEILEVLAATQAEFLLSARDVVYLAQSGVPDAVVQNMLVSLPLQPAAGGGQAAPEPVRLLFTREDLDLLVQGRVSEPIVVTFIDTRDMAFSLDVNVLTSLRNSGLGLDALQLLVEKSAAGLPVPAAPAPAYTTASNGDTYFFGRSSRMSYYPEDQYYAPASFAAFQYTAYSPWDWGFYGYRPFYHSYYPNWAYGHGGHSFYCPRGRHTHRHGHDGDGNHAGQGYAYHGGSDGIHRGTDRRPGTDGRNTGGQRIFFGTGQPAMRGSWNTVVMNPSAGTAGGGIAMPGTARSTASTEPRVLYRSATGGRGAAAGAGLAGAAPRGYSVTDPSTAPGTSPGPITKPAVRTGGAQGRVATPAPAVTGLAPTPGPSAAGTWIPGRAGVTAAPARTAAYGTGSGGSGYGRRAAYGVTDGRSEGPPAGNSRSARW